MRDCATHEPYPTLDDLKFGLVSTIRFLDMEAIRVLLLILVAPLLLLAFGRPAKDGVVETRNVPMATTVFQPAKPHVVKTHWRLAFHQLKLTPYTAQSFDRSRTALGLRLTTSTSWGSFTNAPVAIVIDGKELGRMDREWAIGTGWSTTEETSIEDASVVRAISQGREVFLTVVMLGQQPPFDHISFKLSPEQLEDCRLIVAKYDELSRAEK
jgi:hypothetical protein